MRRTALADVAAEALLPASATRVPGTASVRGQRDRFWLLCGWLLAILRRMKEAQETQPTKLFDRQVFRTAFIQDDKIDMVDHQPPIYKRLHPTIINISNIMTF
jgi:hypothetical protein